MNGLDERFGFNELLTRYKKSSSNLSRFSNFLILNGPWGTPAAFDVESRFHEAGIGAVQVADLRNFAHGRHYWLKRKGRETCVVCLLSKDDEELGLRTLSFLPREIQTLTLSVANSGPVAALGLLLLSIHLTGWVAADHGIDPGCPRVPHFGRRIYRLNAWSKGRLAKDNRSKILERKTGRGVIELLGTAAGRQWKGSLESFVTRLARARFGSMVCDYDGTLCARLLATDI